MNKISPLNIGITLKGQNPDGGLPYYPNETALPIATDHGVVQVGSGLKIANNGVWSNVGGGSGAFALANTETNISVSGGNLGEFTFDGGTISLTVSGIWYIGIDFLSKKLISLPRLGHRGWVPIAKAIVSGGVITSVYPIAPKMYESRLPRTLDKLVNNKQINILVMGSSLAESGGTSQDWYGMLFFGSASYADYKIPSATYSVTNIARGGTPNLFQLAQSGIGSNHSGLTGATSGYPGLITNKLQPNGTSKIFDGVDLVVITTIANSVEYITETIEPIIRQIKKLGIEVILTTDNPGSGPFTNYASMVNQSIHVAGVSVIKIADIYDVELADTSAYMIDANLRYGNSYRDVIHPSLAAPAGRYTTVPSCGYESWARSIRSVIHADLSFSQTTYTYNFNASLQGWVGDYFATATSVNNELVITKNNAASGSWNAFSPALTAVKAGDNITIQGSLRVPVSYGAYPKLAIADSGLIIRSTTFTATSDGNFTCNLVMSQDVTTPRVMIYSNNNAAALGVQSVWDNITVTVNSSVTPIVSYNFSREFSAKPIPAQRVVSDLKTPGGAFVILPRDEANFVASTAYKGTLAASSLGAASFARVFNDTTPSTEDTLVLTTGNRASISAIAAVGFYFVYSAVNGTGALGFDVYVNGAFSKSMTIGAQTLTREYLFSIFTHAEWANASANLVNSTVEIRVTSGTLRIAALFATTFDIEYIPAEQIGKSGTWTGQVLGVAGMPGYASDTSGAYAVINCPLESRRVGWLCSCDINSKTVTTGSKSSSTVNEATAGTDNIRIYGNHVGPGSRHYITLTQTQSNTDQATNGYGLHIGAAILVNDR